MNFTLQRIKCAFYLLSFTIIATFQEIQDGLEVNEEY
jgi:hypothetical protein